MIPLQILQTFLVHFLQRDNVCKIFQTAHNLGLIQLKENCLQYLQSTIENVTDFGNLSPEMMEEIVSSDDLEVSELKLFEIIKSWSKVYATKTDIPPHNFCKPICRHLRLGLLKPDEISKLEEENKKDNIISVSAKQICSLNIFHFLVSRQVRLERRSWTII